MSTTFPGAVDNLSNPAANDTTAGVDHAAQHSNANDAIEAIEAKLGTSASVPSANTVLRGTGAGTSAFAKVGLTTDVTGTLPLANGGTGGTSATTARTALGLGAVATLSTITLTTDVTGILPVANGGTGASSIAGIRTALSISNVDNTSDVNKPLSTAQQAYVDSKTLTTNGFTFNETPSGTVDGSNLVFTASVAYVALSLEVYINGLQQNRTSDYVETTPGSGVFTFVTAPLTGDAVRIGYQTTTGTSGNADTVDGKHAAELSQVGDLIMSMRSTPGTNRLFMNGATYNKSDWPLLWALNSSHPAYFTSSTTLTFTLANMTGRVPVGKDSTTFTVLGNTGGSLTHWHWQTFGNDGSGAYMAVAGNVPTLNANGQSTVTSIDRTTFGSGTRATGAARFDGTGEAGTLQPYIIVNYEVIAA